MGFLKWQPGLVSGSARVYVTFMYTFQKLWPSTPGRSQEYSSSTCLWRPSSHQITTEIDHRSILLLLNPPSGSEPIYHVSSNAANEMELEECPSDDINSIITRKSIYKRKCKKYTTTSVDQIHRKRYFGILSDMHWICPFSSLAFLINCTPIKTFRGYDLHVFPLITPQLSHRHLLSIHSLITEEDDDGTAFNNNNCRKGNIDYLQINLSFLSGNLIETEKGFQLTITRNVQESSYVSSLVKSPIVIDP